MYYSYYELLRAYCYNIYIYIVYLLLEQGQGTISTFIGTQAQRQFYRLPLCCQNLPVAYSLSAVRICLAGPEDKFINWINWFGCT